MISNSFVQHNEDIEPTDDRRLCVAIRSILTQISSVPSRHQQTDQRRKGIMHRKHYTNYGRKDKQRASATHLIRRSVQYGESTNNQLHWVLLDLEKASDMVDREEMFQAMDSTEENTN